MSGNGWVYSPVPQCVDAAGVKLVVYTCPYVSTCQLVLTDGTSVHIAADDMPELVWNLLKASGVEPYMMLRRVAAWAMNNPPPAAETPTVHMGLPKP